MSKWIKPSELTEDFWGEVFIGFKSKGRYLVKNDVFMVRKISAISIEFYLSIEQEWARLRDDVDYRVMPIEYPEITEEDFK